MGNLGKFNDLIYFNVFLYNKDLIKFFLDLKKIPGKL